MSCVAPPPLSSWPVVLLDLDGTVYHEDQPLPGAVALIGRLQREGRRYACLSNSASSPRDVAARLGTMGLDVPPALIYTAAEAMCDLVVARPVEARRVFNLATPSVQARLDDQVTWVHGPQDPCDLVLAAGPGHAYASPERQRIALHLLTRGATLMGLCADRVFPSPRGLEFGAGAMCALLGYAARVTPFYCGKPERVFFLELCARLGVTPGDCILIGDNLESDVRGARDVGMTSVLVLSGVARREDLESLEAIARPDFVIASLEDV